MSFFKFSIKKCVMQETCHSHVPSQDNDLAKFFPGVANLAVKSLVFARISCLHNLHLQPLLSLCGPCCVCILPLSVLSPSLSRPFAVFVSPGRHVSFPLQVAGKKEYIICSKTFSPKTKTRTSASLQNNA